MKILIVGSTGKTGLALIKQARAAGYSVTAFARTPQKLAGINDIAIARGDVLRYDDVLRAMQGQDVVLSALGAPLGGEVGTVRSQGTQNIVAAMEASEVERLIAVSTIGVGDSVERMSWVSKRLLPRIIGQERLNEAALQEKTVMASRLAWTLVRPPRLIDSASTSNVQASATQQTKFADKLARIDLAQFMVEEILTKQFVRQAVTVVN